MAISVITDFEEFAIYDCTNKPKPTDKASNGRIKYIVYSDYIKEFDFIWNTFSKERVLKGSFDKYILSDKNKKGTTTVDHDFLASLDKWRIELARNIALRNELNEDELNFLVQNTLDRIIFLRIAEDRSAEQYGDLKSTLSSGEFYKNLLDRFYIADQKYNSGLFDFGKDKISKTIIIDNKVIKSIISELYYPLCPYEFSILSVEILGSAYEQFLGKETIEAQAKLFHDRILPTLDNNIKSGNSLIDLDYYEYVLDFDEERKIKPFSWQKAFPEVFNRNVPIDSTLPFKKQYQRVKKLHEDTEKMIASLTAGESDIRYEVKNIGFDCVIGNPPYVKVSSKNIFDYFNHKYIHQDYQQDLYLLFLEQYKRLLVTGGMLGVIIPNTWLQSIKFRNIRKYLVNDYFWHKIMHINEHIFKAVVDTHVLVFEKNNYIKNNETEIDIYEKGKIKHHQFIDQLFLQDNGDVINILSSDYEKVLFEKIEAKSDLIRDVSVVYNGAKPFEKGKGKPPQSDKIMKEKPFVLENKPKPDGESWMPLLRGRLIYRYINFWNNNSWIKYGDWLAAPRNPKIFEADEKIVLRQTGDRIIATLIGANIICRDNLHIIISNREKHRFLLGIINSKLTDFYYYQINPEKGEALAQVKKQHVEQLPIPKNVSEHQQNEIIKNVDMLLQLNQELQSATLPNQIEQFKV